MRLKKNTNSAKIETIYIYNTFLEHNENILRSTTAST